MEVKTHNGVNEKIVEREQAALEQFNSIAEIINLYADIEPKAYAELMHILELIYRLKVIEVSTPSHSLVEQALDLIRDAMSEYKYYLMLANILATYHGSLQYHDPYNLDVDVILITNNNDERMVNMGKEVCWNIEAVLMEVKQWPDTGINKGLCEPNMDFTQLDKEVEYLEVCLKQIELDQDDPDNFQHISEQLEELGAYIDPSISGLLTSNLLYPKQKPTQIKLQRRAVECLASSQYLRTAVINDLTEAIEIRMQRRGLDLSFS